MLDALWGGPETLIVVSSDLSHYHPVRARRRRIDRATADAILALAPRPRPRAGLRRHAGQRPAAGRPPPRPGARAARPAQLRRHRRRPRAAWSATPRSPSPRTRRMPPLTSAAALLADRARRARRAPRRRRRRRRARPPTRRWRRTGATLRHADAARRAARLHRHAGGAPPAARGRRAQRAGRGLPRPALRAARRAPSSTITRVEVSLLSPPAPLPVAGEDDALRAAAPRRRRRGARVGAAGARTFLPQVWEQLPDPREFLAAPEAQGRAAAGLLGRRRAPRRATPSTKLQAKPDAARAHAQ